MAKLKKNSEDWFTTESGDYVVVPLRTSGESREGETVVRYFSFYTTSSSPSTRIEWEGKFALLNSEMAEFLVRQKYARKAVEADFPKPEAGKVKKVEPAESVKEAPVEPQPEETGPKEVETEQ